MPPAAAELEEIQQPGTPGRLAGARQAMPLDDGIDGARLARIGPTGEGDLRTLVGRKLCGRRGTDQKMHIGKSTHDFTDRKPWHDRSVQSGALGPRRKENNAEESQIGLKRAVTAAVLCGRTLAALAQEPAAAPAASAAPQQRPRPTRSRTARPPMAPPRPPSARMPRSERQQHQPGVAAPGRAERGLHRRAAAPVSCPARAPIR